MMARKSSSRRPQGRGEKPSPKRPVPASAISWKRRGLEALVVFVLLNIYLALFQDALIDDAFINLRYAKTLLASGTWGFFPGHTANTATSPLVILVLTGLGAVFGVGPGCVRLASALWLLLLLAILLRLSRRLLGKPWAGVVAFVALLANPLLLSTLGLESFALAVFFFGALLLLLEQHWRLAGAMAGALVLCRPDALLLALVLVAFVPGWRSRLGFLACAALTVAPWYAYSWLALGALVPDSYFLKTIEHAWDHWTFGNGLWLYLRRFPVATLVSVLPALLLAFAASPARKKVRALLLPCVFGALAHAGGLALLGVPPYHWYYAPALCLFAVAGIFVAAAHASEGQTWPRASRVALLSGAALPAVFIIVLLASQGPRLAEAPIHTNWATPGDYKIAGEWLKTHHDAEPILMAVECGTLAYYCDCLLQDPFGDRRWIDQRVLPRAADSGLGTALVRANFAFYKGAPAWPAARNILAHLSDRRRTLPGRIQQWPTTSKWKGDGTLVYATSSAPPRQGRAGAATE
jgi:hypothetical protein